MNSFILSKSTYIRGLQCLKSLYLNKHRPYLRDKLSEEQLAKFARGHAVGKIAWQLFPGGIEMPRPGEAAAAKTRKCLAERVPVIYEACFIHNEVIIAIDILVKGETGWQAYEVKSSGALSETYYNDAFVQQYVMTGSGLDLRDFFLVYRDLSVEYSEGIDVQKLFRFEKLPDQSLEKQSEIESSLALMKETLLQKSSPSIPPGLQCMKPYPCDFRGVCWKNLGEEEKRRLGEGGMG